jgi:hypothetical protein
MRGPGLARFRLDVSETGARRRVRDADQMVAGGTLNLPAGMARIALQRLVAMGTIKFEFVRVHSIPLWHAHIRHKKYLED